MSQRVPRRAWAVLGVGIAVVAALGLLLAFLGREPGQPASISTPATPTPPDDPVVASVNDRPIRYSSWTEAVLVDQAISGLARQPASTPDETLQRLINEELVMETLPPGQSPTAAQIEARIAALEQTWGVDDGAVVTALEQAGLTRAAFEQTIGRLLAIQAGLETLQGQGHNPAAWLEEQRASARIVLNDEVKKLTVPHIPVAQPSLVTPITPPIPTPVTETPTPSHTPVPATETTSPTPAIAIPQVAPDFALERAGGGTLTLAEQLAQGPVVLVFFQRCG